MPSWYGDPSIPRRPAPRTQRRKGFPTVGWLVRRMDGEIFLQSHRGQTWPLRFVQLCQGTWGAVDNSEGTSKLPRVREYDANGVVTVAGDRVKIEALDGDPQMVVITGGVRGLAASDFLPYNPARPGANTNRLAGRLAPLDEDGQTTGYVDWELAADNEASLVLRFEDAANAPGEGPPGGPSTTLEVRDGAVRISLGNGTQINLTEALGIELGQGTPIDPYILSLAFFADLASALTEIASALSGLGAPVPDVLLFAADLLASAAAGPPYLSTVVKGS